jgi:spore coat protein U-like protein
MPKRRPMTRAAMLCAFLLVLAPAVARAAIGTCVVTATDINFGTYSGTRLTASGTVTLRCSGSGNNQVQVNLSTGSSNIYLIRTMKNGGSNLFYNLYTDSTTTQIFGDGSGASQPVTVPVNFATRSPPGPQVTVNVTVFAVLPAQPTPPFAPYSDLITVTLSTGATTTFPVTANVPPSCSVSASNLHFGNYNMVQLDATTTVSATCTPGSAYNIGLDQGVSTGATVANRKMTGPGANRLGYSLFSNAGRTTNWGNTVGTDTVPATGTGAAQTFTVFGRIPASQRLAPGDYADTITVTLFF